MGVGGVCAARASDWFGSENKWDAIGASFLVKKFQKNGKAAAAPVVAPAGRPRCWVSIGCAAGGDGRNAIAGDAAEIAGEVEV